MPRNGVRWSFAALIGLVLLCTCPPQAALAQSWSSGQGTGSVSLTYQLTKVRNHLFSGDVTPFGGQPGGRLDLGHITGQSVNLSANYTVIPNLSLSTSLAYVGGEYHGNAPESAILDDGKFHGSMQDASVGLAYAVPAAGFVIIPTGSVSFPVTNYEHHGHVAPGTHNTTFAVGAALGRSLTPLLPNGYAQVSYARDITKDVGIWDLDGNSYGASLGYFVLPQLSVRGYFTYYQVVDGIDWYNDNFSQNDAEHFHDAAAKVLARRAGGSLSYQLDASKGVFLDIGAVVSGVNTHDGVNYSLGTTWNFLTPFAR